MPYTWIDDWANVPDPGTHWAHAGIAVDLEGVVLTTHPNGSSRACACRRARTYRSAR
jgi:hypothetical protein